MSMRLCCCSCIIAIVALIALIALLGSLFVRNTRRVLRRNAEEAAIVIASRHNATRLC